MQDNGTLIIIPSYNTGRFLVKCLDAIIRDHEINEDRHGEIQLRIIENGSDDRSAKILSEYAERHPELFYVAWLDKNIGVYPAWNLGAGISTFGREIFEGDAPDVVMLGADTEVETGWLVAFQRLARKVPDLGIQSAKLIQERDGRRFVTFGGTIDIWGRWHIQGWDDTGRFDAPKEFNWVTFSGVWIRGSVLAKIGGFDTEFNIYGGDRDFCLRARAAGFAIYYNGESSIIHYDGKGVEERKKRDGHFAELIASDHLRLYKLYGEIDENIPERYKPKGEGDEVPE